ncbi:hypothetical protein [Paenibacillus methanolicus]|uniref:Uncharacterized protein n=1 Tax=Paenibacillus methanolicus TaxID=582686 RepID=A0A5S5BP65_9BACL|nr:hypothetical protein [Paenibacillus methanolicus]TYP68096.1 hypothetical protein BCM02_12056 [Paenibacillus methanolicus]
MGLPLDENAYIQGLYLLKHVARATDAESEQSSQTVSRAQLLVAPLLDRLFAEDRLASVTHEEATTRITVLKQSYRLDFRSELPGFVAITGVRLNGWRRGWPVAVYRGPLYEDDVLEAVRRTLTDWYRQTGGMDL